MDRCMSLRTTPFKYYEPAAVFEDAAEKLAILYGGEGNSNIDQ